MKNKEAYIRYQLIDECLRNRSKSYPTMEDLIDYCEQKIGKSFGMSTIKKDLSDMRNDELLGYHAPIEFSKIDKGYYYSNPDYSIAKISLTNDDLEKLQLALDVLHRYEDIKHIAGFSDVLEKVLKTVRITNNAKVKNIEQVIQLETAPAMKGMELIDEMANYIIEKQPISFDYFSYYTKKIKKHLVHPYLIKEYRNRWYVVALEHDVKEVRVFGLDRISNCIPEPISFTKSADFNAEMLFKYSFGITINDLKPAEIILSFSAEQRYYFLSQPVHATQEVIKDTDKEFRIKITVIPSYELIQFIKSFGSKVKVLSPASLQKQVNER
jgi:predicted DNA-binding transcriptional regulator YafY